MKSYKILYISAPVIAIAVICLCALAYEMGKSSGNADIDSLRNMLSTLESEHYDAAVTKRVSRQMEDIAYQQKSISDQQRALAEQNAAQAKQNADQAALNAAEARQNAARAQQNAEEARLAQQQAERNADDARRNALQAKLAKDISDTINYRTMGRTLGRSSLVKYSAGDYELASLLAYASWYFLERYKGNHYIEDSYKALLACTNTSLHCNLPRFSSANAAVMLPGTRQCVVATGYGEVFLLNTQDSKITSQQIFHDKTYDLRSLHITTDGTIYALSNDGTLLSLTTNGTHTAYPATTGTQRSTTTKPRCIYRQIIPAGKEQLLLVADKELTWFNTRTAKRSTQSIGSRTISTACRQQNIIQIFYTDATYAELTLSGTLQSKPAPCPGVITCADYSPELGFTYYGMSNGVIRTINRYGNWLDLIGHTTRITSISHLGDIMVANGYDHESHVWNMPQLHYATGYSLYSSKSHSDSGNTSDKNSAPTEWQVPSGIRSEGWPLCSCIDATSQTVWIGTSNGQIHNISLSPDMLADKLRSYFKRDLTNDEWEHYVGLNIPKINFK